MHETFMPPPKPDVLQAPPAPADDPSQARRRLTVVIGTTLALAGLCFALLLLVDRRYGWPAYAALFSASVFTVVRDRLGCRT